MNFPQYFPALISTCVSFLLEIKNKTRLPFRNYPTSNKMSQINSCFSSLVQPYACLNVAQELRKLACQFLFSCILSILCYNVV